MQHTLFYDADCPLCQRAMARARAANRSGSLALLPVQGYAAFHYSDALVSAARYL